MDSVGMVVQVEVEGCSTVHGQVQGLGFKV